MWLNQWLEPIAFYNTNLLVDLDQKNLIDTLKSNSTRVIM